MRDSATACKALMTLKIRCMHAGWWYKPDFIINDININSAVTSPAHDEVITLAEGNSHVSIAGYAYSGAFPCPCLMSTCKLSRVL